MGIESIAVVENDASARHAIDKAINDSKFNGSTKYFSKAKQIKGYTADLWIIVNSIGVWRESLGNARKNSPGAEVMLFSERPEINNFAYNITLRNSEGKPGLQFQNMRDIYSTIKEKIKQH